MDALTMMCPWDELILDHDIGALKLHYSETGRELTGYDIAKFLEESSKNGNDHLIPAKVTVCTSNGPGLKNIGAALDQFMDKKGPRTWVRRS